MKKTISMLLAMALAFAVFAACGGNGGEAPPDSSDNSGDSSASEPPVQELNINLLTGEEAAEGYNPNLRPVAVMVNNIKQSWPQSGITSADVVYEIVTEGGITRLMCVFSDYTQMPKVGPVRSARDQMVQLMMPMGYMYFHIGGSTFAQDMLDYYGYYVHEIDFKENSSYLWFDQARRNSGMATEHCWYITGEAATSAVAKLGTITVAERQIPLFHFVPFDEEPRVLTDGESSTINIRFSSGYASTFSFENGRYYKSQNGQPQIDTNNGEQLAFDNLLILFTTIEQYPGTPLAKVDFSFGGVGYYFNNGRYEKVRWLKGTPTEPLRIVDAGGNEIDVLINPGQCYIAFVSLEEAGAFTY